MATALGPAFDRFARLARNRVTPRPSAPPGAEVKLRQVSGEPIPDGTELRTFTGRRYLVLRRGGKTLHCVVLGPNSPVQGPVVDWINNHGEIDFGEGLDGDPAWRALAPSSLNSTGLAEGLGPTR